MISVGPDAPARAEPPAMGCALLTRRRIGLDFLGSASADSTSETKWESVESVAPKTFAMLSVDGQRCLPSEDILLELLNVVGSSPESRARADTEIPISAANRSIARQSSL